MLERLKATLQSPPDWLSRLPLALLNATVRRWGLRITQGQNYGPQTYAKLDIYRPARPGALPVVIFFYGGSWRTGRRQDYKFLAAPLARAGHVVVVADYRLYPKVQYPNFLSDCAQATAWTLTHLAEIGGDPARVYLMGHSAGAYNAAMLALNQAYLRAAGADPSQLAGMIGLAGPYDFLPIKNADVIPVFASAPDDPASMPIAYARAGAPRLLLLHGAPDTLVKPRNSQALADQMTAAGGAASVKIYPDTGHIAMVLAMAPLFSSRAPVRQDIEAFIRAVA
jgi:acetyl esterase/lipase